MKAVNLFLFPYISRCPRHGEIQKDLTFASSFVIRKMGKSFEAACKLSNFLFVQAGALCPDTSSDGCWLEDQVQITLFSIL